MQVARFGDVAQTFPPVEFTPERGLSNPMDSNPLEKLKPFDLQPAPVSTYTSSFMPSPTRYSFRFWFWYYA